MDKYVLLQDGGWLILRRVDHGYTSDYHFVPHLARLDDEDVAKEICEALNDKARAQGF